MNRLVGLILASVALTGAIACAPPDDATGEAVSAEPAGNEVEEASGAPGEAAIFVPSGDDVQMTVPSPAPLVHTWVDAVVAGANLEVPLSDVQRCEHVHVDLCEAGVTCDDVLCWVSEEEFVVGAALCPSCETGVLSCDGQVLGQVFGCDSCHEGFDLLTGASVSGDSDSVSLARVPFAVTEDALTADMAEVLAAVGSGMAEGDELLQAEVESGEQEVTEVLEEEPKRDLPSCCS